MAEKLCYLLMDTVEEIQSNRFQNSTINGQGIHDLDIATDRWATE